MATSNNDRVSSARLLDMIKGLQESRHLGSEPEVDTETVEKMRVTEQHPQAGNYNASDFINAITDVEPNTPVYVFGPSYSVAGSNISVQEGNEILATLNYRFSWENSGTTFIVFTETPVATKEEVQAYTGYMVTNSDAEKFMGGYFENGVGGNDRYPYGYYETYEETTTTKTKHTIKQDYVPNADWNQNDPDGDGYVEGRTHWVEETNMELNVSNDNGIDAINTMIKPTGFRTSDTTWESQFSALEFNTTTAGYNTLTYMLCEDENGNQITDYTMAVTQGFYNGIILADYSVLLPNTIIVMTALDGNMVTATSVIGNDEVVHKLDKKYYDYTPPVDLSGYLETRNAYRITSGSDYCYFLDENVITNLDDNKKKVGEYTFEPVDTKMNLYVDRSDNSFFYLRKGFGNRIWYLYPISHSNSSISMYIPYIGVGKKIIITPGLRDSKTYAPDPSQYYDMFIPNVGYYWNYRNQNGSTNVTEFYYEGSNVSIVDENNHLVGDIFGVNMPSEVRDYYKSYSSVDNIGYLNRPLRLGAVSNSQYVNYTSKSPYLSFSETTKYTTSLNGKTLYGTITIEEAPTSSSSLCDKKRVKSFEYDVTSDINLSSDTFTTVENVFGIDLTTFDVVLPDGRYGKFSKTTMTLNDNTSVNRLPAGSLIYKHGRFDIG